MYMWSKLLLKAIHYRIYKYVLDREHFTTSQKYYLHIHDDTNTINTTATKLKPSHSSLRGLLIVILNVVTDFPLIKTRQLIFKTTESSHKCFIMLPSSERWPLFSRRAVSMHSYPLPHTHNYKIR